MDACIIKFQHMHEINTKLSPMKRCILRTPNCCRLLYVTHAASAAPGGCARRVTLCVCVFFSFCFGNNMNDQPYKRKSKSYQWKTPLGCESCAAPLRCWGGEKQKNKKKNTLIVHKWKTLQRAAPSEQLLPGAGQRD